ncbi:hypothetical protein CQ13_08775 [Bradyrhizobium retamae]|uniref:Uncharacterized protein n=2 Tax=Bradyrhizobium retamae TaxID=1300035 RepID=A0A0R3MIB5_9BRAD|nr:hypothetical protein CQ13_08775 [Bradyrhizobium retamae]
MLSPKPCERREVELAKRPPMDGRTIRDFEQLDHRTCVSICDAIGERLQQNFRPETELPPRLRELVDELRRRDSELH